MSNTTANSTTYTFTTEKVNKHSTVEVGAYFLIKLCPHLTDTSYRVR